MADEALEQRLLLHDRYLGLKQRASDVVDRMHPLHGETADLDGLEAVVSALERVALHGDRIEVTSAQKLAAERRAAAAEGAVEGNPATAEDLAGVRGDPAPSGDPGDPPALVVKQTPPVAKKGRGRGFRLTGDA